MTNSPEPTPTIPSEEKPQVEKKSHLGATVRWAARLSSLPIFGLLLISLLPAIANFAVSAKDDKVIAVSLCGVAIGFVVAWRWPGIGGLIALGSVAAIITQEGGDFAADPFSVAFALQGILFLISWAVNTSPGTNQVAPQLRWLKAGAAAILVVAAVAGATVILRGPPPIPVGRGQEVYVGTWQNGAGFTMEITTEGRVKVSLDKDAKVAPCNTPIPPGAAGEFLAQFRDNRLDLSGAGVLGETKVYQIDRPPFSQGKQIKMVLNGSDPYYRTNGMILIKKTAAKAEASKPDKRR